MVTVARHGGRSGSHCPGRPFLFRVLIESRCLIPAISVLNAMLTASVAGFTAGMSDAGKGVKGFGKSFTSVAGLRGDERGGSVGRGPIT